MEFLPTTSRLRCQSSLALGGMTQYVAILRTVFSVFLGVPPCRHRRTNSTPWSGNIRVIPHFTVPQNGEMIGISTVRFPFAMPILTSFGGMTYSILGAQPAENATMRMPLRASARRGCGPRSPADCNINARQPIPRQKRFRIKGGCGDGALRIGNLLIASKVPQASDSA